MCASAVMNGSGFWCSELRLELRLAPSARQAARLVDQPVVPASGRGNAPTVSESAQRCALLAAVIADAWRRLRPHRPRPGRSSDRRCSNRWSTCSWRSTAPHRRHVRGRSPTAPAPRLRRRLLLVDGSAFARILCQRLFNDHNAMREACAPNGMAVKSDLCVESNATEADELLLMWWCMASACHVPIAIDVRRSESQLLCVMCSILWHQPAIPLLPVWLARRGGDANQDGCGR